MERTLRKVIKGVRDPVRAVDYVLKPAYRNTAVRATSRFPVGRHVLRRDWDVLVVLDTCRVDALRAVADEYTFVNDVKRCLSVGGSSPEWMVQTFDRRWRETLQETAYLTANAWAERVIDDRLQPEEPYADFEILTRLTRFGAWDPVRANELGRLERIWKYTADEEQLTEEEDPRGLMPGGAPPRYVTDRAISVGRAFDYDRIILHYIQPHAPYVAAAMSEDRPQRPYEKDPFEYVRTTGSRTEVWNAYLDELRYVLDDLEILLENIDAETVVVTADHGEAFGEFNVYNHHTGSFHPKIRVVPWMVTSATDSRSYSPERTLRERENLQVEEALRHLGYR